MGAATAVVGPPDVASVVVGGGALMLSGMARQYIQRRRQLTSLLSYDDRPVIVINPDSAEVHAAALLVHDIFRGTSLIASSLMASAAQSNKFSCLVVYDDRSNVIGFVELWALRQRRLLALLKGDIAESDLVYEDFQDHDSGRKNAHVYVRITVPGSATEEISASAREHSRLMAATLYGFLEALREGYLRHGIRVFAYAIAQTPEAQDFLEQTGWRSDAVPMTVRSGCKRRNVWKLEVTDTYVRETEANWRLDDSRARLIWKQGKFVDGKEDPGTLCATELFFPVGDK
jgi:hypothetical protein